MALARHRLSWWEVHRSALFKACWQRWWLSADQVPRFNRLVSAPWLCVPIASVTGTFVVQLFTGNQLAIFLAPAPSAVSLSFPRADSEESPAVQGVQAGLDAGRVRRTFYVTRGRTPTCGPSPALLADPGLRLFGDFPGVLLLTGSGAPSPEVPQQIFLSTWSVLLVVAASLTEAGCPTVRADGRSSSSLRQWCTARRCS